MADIIIFNLHCEAPIQIFLLRRIVTKYGQTEQLKLSY